MSDTIPSPTVVPQIAQNGHTEAAKRLDERGARRVRIAALRAAEWKLDLTNGATATLRDPEGLTNGERNILKNFGVRIQIMQDTIAQAMAPEDPTKVPSFDLVDRLVSRLAEDMGRGDGLLIALFLRDWSAKDVAGNPVPMPVVTNLSPLDQLNKADYDRLLKACNDLAPELYVDLEDTAESDSPKGLSIG